VPKFFTFDNHFDGVGVVPQHQTMGAGYDYDAPDSVYNLSFDALVEFTPNFNTVILDDSAVLTDLVSSAPIRNSGFIVSSRLRTIIDEFPLPTHRYYPLPVEHRGNAITDYWWLHLPQPEITIPPDAKREAAENAILNSEISDVALFRFYRPPRFAYCYVRADLRLAIENAGVTGVRFATSRLFR
jgi:hypothetical protein